MRLRSAPTRRCPHLPPLPQGPIPQPPQQHARSAPSTSPPSTSHRPNASSQLFKSLAGDQTDWVPPNKQRYYGFKELVALPSLRKWIGNKRPTEHFSSWNHVSRTQACGAGLHPIPSPNPLERPLPS